MVSLLQIEEQDFGPGLGPDGEVLLLYDAQPIAVHDRLAIHVERPLATGSQVRRP